MTHSAPHINSEKAFQVVWIHLYKKIESRH